MFKRWAASWWRFVMRQVAHANTKTNAVLGWAGNFQLLLVVGAWAFAEDWKNRVVAELPRSGPLRSAFSRVSPTIGLVYPAQPGSPFTHVAFQDVRLKACVDGLQIIIDQIEAGGDHAHD